MKICLVNNTYSPFDRGGSDRITSILSDEILRKNHELLIITLKPFFSKTPALDFGRKEIIYLNSFFPYLGRLPKFLRFFWLLSDLFNLRKYFQIRNLLNKNKIDLVISGNLRGLGGFSPLIFSSNSRLHCHILHDTQLLYPSGIIYYRKEKILESIAAKIFSRLNIYIFKKTSLVISPSQWLIEIHKKYGFFCNTRSLIRYNPIKINVPITDNYKIEPFDIIFIGEITREKGIELYLKTAKMLEKIQPNIIFHIVGTGPLVNLIKYSSNIKYYGYLANKKVKEMLSNMNALVLPSLCYENSPTVLFEAIQASLPFICSELGGSREVAKDFDGYTFNPEEPSDLKEKILYLKNNYPEIYKKAQANIKKLEDYNAASYLDEILKILF